MMKNGNLNHYKKLAYIVDYPRADFFNKVKEAEKSLTGYDTVTLSIFNEFSQFLNTTPLEKVEELYLRTFDIQAVTTLDIGYVLFGDDYKRGELLVNLSKEHKKVNNDCGNELSDYLPNLLKLLPKITDEEFRNELVEIIILPALAKIIKEFEVKSINMKNNVYKRKYKTLIEQPENYGRIFLKPLLIIQKVLEEDFNSSVLLEEHGDTSFTDSIITEIKID
ncbi:MAG TPA: hypothetical protein ENI57_05130 [Ignavibacteria bacterium]|nr:hypothetical protein [Ignavibacteria bacterium]